MSPKISNSQPAAQKSENGFTLVEFLIAMALSSLVLLGVVKLFNISQWSYSMQDQQSEMNLNAHYTVKKIMEIISMAGYDLPDSTFDVIIPDGNPGSDITIMVNPRGGTYEFDSLLSNVTDIMVDDGKKFEHADSIIIHRSDETYETVALSSISGNTITIGASKSFNIGDAIYSFSKHRYWLDSANTSLCDHNGDVLAENLDLLSIEFLDAGENLTGSWQNMKFANVKVRSRTSDEDPKYTHPVEGDGYRRVELNMKFRLRNRM